MISRSANIRRDKPLYKLEPLNANVNSFGLKEGRRKKEEGRRKKLHSDMIKDTAMPCPYN